ncbi:MBL fold metallo-hydrolase [Campylobacter jejuni]|nr:MBL fold metallo-hydrolase [Campylobacter jejuni]
MFNFIITLLKTNLYFLEEKTTSKSSNQTHIISLKQSDDEFLNLLFSFLVPQSDEDKNFIGKTRTKIKRNEHNIALIKNPNFNALIDTGFLDTIDTLKEKLHIHKTDFKDITHIILTHAHPDHIGALMSEENLFPKAQILIDKKEYDFWIKSDRQEIKNTLLKLKNIEFINHSKDLIFQNSGIKAIPAYGHTPGQNAIIIDDKIVFWGDLLHLYDIQIPKPKIAIKFDIDQNEAIQTREKLLKQFKERKLKIIGTHVPFIEPKFLD